MDKLEEISLEFKSGNEIPIKRASLTLEEWRYVRHEIKKARLGS